MSDRPIWGEEQSQQLAMMCICCERDPVKGPLLARPAGAKVLQFATLPLATSCSLRPDKPDG
ncbi:MAG: hypothetical protein KDB01_15705, partial [Planctomycetaceae bacterium]|nr:hypothetical protein [Planctomycetaceae bacterium]